MTVARIAFSYKLLRVSDGVLLAEGETVHAFANRNGRPINLKKHCSNIYNTLYELAKDKEE